MTYPDVTAADLGRWDTIARSTGDGVAILDDTRAQLARFVMFPSQAALDIVTLWTAHTHVLDASGHLAFYTTPRLAFLSDRPGSGKSRALESVSLLSHNGLMLVQPTAASYVHAIESRKTPCLDETDILFGRGSAHAELRAILNTGYKRGGEWARGSQDSIPVFGPAAMAGLDRAFRRAGSDLSTLRSRTLMVIMAPAGPGRVESYRPRLHDAEMAAIRDTLAQWARRHSPEITDLYPDTDAVGLYDRHAEVAEPILMVADVAGGPWPDRARDGLRALLLADSAEDPEPALSHRLLHDVARVMRDHDAVADEADRGRMASVDIIDALYGLDDVTWREQWPDQARAPGEMARMLARYDVAPRPLWIGGRTRRGYVADELPAEESAE